MERAEAFLTHGLAGYVAARDQPAGDGTSMLSPHLHFGEISAAQLWHMAHQRPAGKAREILIRQLLWREFRANLLWHNPDLPEAPLKPEFAKMPWRDDKQALSAWQQGRTGVPIVDAGMRQLWWTGWMHNRVRMIVASYPIKHLLIPWQDGEAWFWDTLADLASNAGNWQWVAGRGADAAPYFRIFNPVLQEKKSTPTGITSATGFRNQAGSTPVTSMRRGMRRPTFRPKPASFGGRPIRSRSWTSPPAEHARWMLMRGFARQVRGRE
jgi:deoxyribodipyrimidine photo-lyase